MKKNNNNDILFIPDCHAHPDYDNRRFDWLGRFIVDRKPNTILQIGDFADLPSLSGYDKGRKSFEGRRLRRDIRASLDAQSRLFRAVESYNSMRSRNRKRQYNPRTILTLGNHEARIERAVESSPELDGTISIDDLQFDKYWDTIVPFKESINVEGFLCSHYFPSGVMGRPISGPYAANHHIAKLRMSTLSGHSHLRAECEAVRGDGKPLYSLVGGWFGHPDMIEGWNRDTNYMWWNGVHLLRDVNEGSPLVVERITQEYLRKYYSK